MRRLLSQLRTALSIACALVCAAGPALAETTTVLNDVVYANRGKERLLADVYLPSGVDRAPGVLLVHGGAWVIGNKSHMAALGTLLARHGYTAVSINYRLAPRFAFPAQIEDCKTAIRWMRSNAAKYRIDSEQIAGFGYSAGGHLVALLGATDPTCGLEGSDAEPNCPSTRLQAVVAGGAPCDFRWLPADNPRLSFWLGGTRAEKPEMYKLASPLSFVSGDDPPMFFYHGERDHLVPAVSPRVMVARLTSAGVAATLLTIPDAGHMAAFFDSRGPEAAVEFLDRHLRKQAPAHKSP